MVPDPGAGAPLRSHRPRDVHAADEAVGDADDRRRQHRQDPIPAGHLRPSWCRMPEGALPQHPLHFRKEVVFQFFKAATTLLDLLHIELMLHLSHVKQMCSQPIHRKHDFIWMGKMKD